MGVKWPDTFCLLLMSGPPFNFHLVVMARVIMKNEFKFKLSLFQKTFADRLTGLVTTSGHSKDGSASRDCGASAVQSPSSLFSEQSVNQPNTNHSE